MSTCFCIKVSIIRQSKHISLSLSINGNVLDPRDTRALLRFLRVRDRWEDVERSVRQLVLGTWMVLDARRQRLAGRHFERLRQQEPPPGCPAHR